MNFSCLHSSTQRTLGPLGLPGRLFCFNYTLFAPLHVPCCTKPQLRTATHTTDCQLLALTLPNSQTHSIQLPLALISGLVPTNHYLTFTSLSPPMLSQTEGCSADLRGLLGPQNQQTQYNSEKLYFVLRVTLAFKTLPEWNQSNHIIETNR
jgi:hypothetical protein